MKIVSSWQMDERTKIALSWAIVGAIKQFTNLVLVLSLWSVGPHCSISNTGTAGAEATFRLYFARTLTLLCFVRVVFLRSRSRRSDHRSRAWQLVCTMRAWCQCTLCQPPLRSWPGVHCPASHRPMAITALIRSALISIESLARRRQAMMQWT